MNWKNRAYRAAIVAGFFSLAATMVWFFFGDRFSITRSSGNDTYSVSALGHRALTRNLEDGGFNVRISTHTTEVVGSGADLVLVLEPYLSSRNRIGLDAFDRINQLKTPVLVSIPKRWGSPADVRNPHISRHGLETLEDSQWAADAFDPALVLKRVASTTCRDQDGAEFEIQDAQLLNVAWGETIIDCDDGVLVARHSEASNRWVVSDPDIFSNFRQDETAMADLARRVIRHAAGSSANVVIDETTHGHIHPPTIGRFLTSWPNTPLTGQLTLIFLIFGWMALVRLGKPKSANLDLPLGKEAMIQNAAELMAFGGHSGHMISRYVRANILDLCSKLHAPAADFDLQVKWLQERIDARGIQADLANIVDRAETLAFARGPTLDRQILTLAKETYILRQELLHE
jgi:hypothetical protein